MKPIKLVPIKEPDLIVGNALEIIRGGTGITCNENNCSNNKSSCGVNNCQVNSGDYCEKNGCQGNGLSMCTEKGIVCHCVSPACNAYFKPVNPG